MTFAMGVSPLTFEYDLRAHDKGFLPEQQAAMARWLANMSREVSIVIVVRAVLRAAPNALPAFCRLGEPPGVGDLAQRVEQEFVLGLQFGAGALLASRALESDPLMIIRRVLGNARSQSNFDLPSLVSSAAFCVLADDFSSHTVATIRLAVASAFHHIAVDPGTTHSYAPSAAATTLRAVVQDLAQLSEGVEPAMLSEQPLWNRGEGGEYGWGQLARGLPTDAKWAFRKRWYEDRLKGSPINVVETLRADPRTY